MTRPQKIGRLLEKNGTFELLNRPSVRKIGGGGEADLKQAVDPIKQGETQGSIELSPVETLVEGNGLVQRTKTLRPGHLRMVNGERVESREWMAAGEGKAS